MNQGLLERILTAGEDGTALTNSTTATSILNAARKYTLPALYFDRVARELRVRAAGRISTVVTTPGTLTFELKFGSIVVATSGALTLNTTAQTNVGWILEWILNLRAIGAGTSANLMAQGSFKSHAVIGSAAPTAGGAGEHILPYNTAPVVGSGFDATASQTVDLLATWSVANASNSIQLHQFAIDAFTG
jgi:hypothetical protein